MASSFLNLPPELRLQIIKTVFSSLRTLDQINVTYLKAYYAAPYHERARRQSFSILYANSFIFWEALELVVETHPVTFYRIEDLNYVLIRRRQLMDKARYIRVQLHEQVPSTQHRALQLLGQLPSLQTIGIRISESNAKSSDREGIFDNGVFPALERMFVYDPEEDQRQKEARNLHDWEEFEVRQLNAILDHQDMEQSMKLKSDVQIQEIEIARLKRSILDVQRRLGDLRETIAKNNIDAINRKLEIEVLRHRLARSTLRE